MSWERQVKKQYPDAACVPWWLDTPGDRYQIHKDDHPFQERELGRGDTPRNAWASAFAALKNVMKDGK